MSTRMTPLEKLQHYAGRVYVFESKNHFAIGKYTFSEYLFLIIVGLVFAYIIPQILSTEALQNLLLLLVGIYVLYYVACFLLSGGRGRVVDVLN